MEIPLELDFILYKHGPFSFDLRDELTSLRADELLVLVPHWRYGPRISPTDRSDYIQRLFSKTLEKYGPRISFVSQKLGPSDVTDLERLATALFITKRLGASGSSDERAELLTELKPHISRESAVLAVKAVDRIIREAETRRSY
jgi:hypothetical protein